MIFTYAPRGKQVSPVGESGEENGAGGGKGSGEFAAGSSLEWTPGEGGGPAYGRGYGNTRGSGWGKGAGKDPGSS
jgi:hypothetical protein